MQTSFSLCSPFSCFSLFSLLYLFSLFSPFSLLSLLISILFFFSLFLSFSLFFLSFSLSFSHFFVEAYLRSLVIVQYIELDVILPKLLQKLVPVGFCVLRALLNFALVFSDGGRFGFRGRSDIFSFIFIFFSVKR